MTIAYGKMEKEDNKRRQESKKRRAEHDDPTTRSLTARSKPRPQLSEEIVVDDEDESSSEEGHILFDGQTEPLQDNHLSPSDTRRSPDKRQKTAPIAVTTSLKKPAGSREYQPGRTVYPPPARPVAGVSCNPRKLTADALTTLRPLEALNADNTHSVLMGESDETEVSEALQRNVPSSTSSGAQHERDEVSYVLANTTVPGRKDPTNKHTSISTATNILPPSGDKPTPSLHDGTKQTSPTPIVPPGPACGRSSSLHMANSTTSSLNAGNTPEGGNHQPPSTTQKAPLPPTQDMTQESKIIEICTGLSYLFQTRATDGKKRAEDEKTANLYLKHQQQQIEDLKQCQQSLEKLIAAQATRLEELAAQCAEKDQKITELETFRDRLIDVLKTPVPRRSGEKEPPGDNLLVTPDRQD
ncbi:hypothetical protein BJX64DRAFT_254014 [Aspergillus heterothallicus]